MKFVTRYALGLIALAACTSAFAQSAVTQTPHSIHVFPNQGAFVFYATVTDGVPPVCPGGADRWAVQTSAPGADALISMIVTAHVSGKTITAVGTGQCDASGSGYEVDYLYLN